MLFSVLIPTASESNRNEKLKQELPVFSIQFLHVFSFKECFPTSGTEKLKELQTEIGLKSFQNRWSITDFT